MAQLEELLEKKPDAVSEDMGYSTPSDAYPEDEWEKQKLKGWPRQIHVFGMRQNQINRGTAARLRALEIQNRTLEIKIQRLEEELEGLAAREKKILGRVAAEMDTMQAEINRLRLSTQLNSNALGPHSAAAGTGKRRERKRFPGIVIDTEQRRQALQNGVCRRSRL